MIRQLDKLWGFWKHGFCIIHVVLVFLSLFSSQRVRMISRKLCKTSAALFTKILTSKMKILKRCNSYTIFLSCILEWSIFKYVHKWSKFDSYSGHGCAYFNIMQRQIFNLIRKNFYEKGHRTSTIIFQRGVCTLVYARILILL
jgi:hypothetical protein